MSSTFLSFVALGVSLGIPVGPIMIEMVKQGVRSGFWHSLFICFGALFADLVFVTLIYAGLAQYLMEPFPKMVMWAFGSATLLYLGWDSIKEAFRPIVLTSTSHSSLFQCFLSGFSLAALNPINILFWVGIYGSALATIIDKVAFEKTLLYSSAIFIGIFGWDVFLSSSIHFSRKLFSPSIIQLFSIIAGLALMGFGIYFATELIELHIL